MKPARVFAAKVTLLAMLCTSCVSPPPETSELPDYRRDFTHCPVHGDRLIESVNSLDTERGSYVPTYFQVREELFPCASDDPSGIGSPARVTYCPQCRAAKAHAFEALRDVDVYNQQAVVEFIAKHRPVSSGNFANGDD